MLGLYFASSKGSERSGKADFYFAPKYQAPLGTPVSWGGLNADIGWVWENGMLFGFDVDFGLDNRNSLGGAGLSFGKEYDLGDQMRIDYGGSVGLWLVEDSSRYIDVDFLAPFVRWRKSFFEITTKQW